MTLSDLLTGLLERLGLKTFQKKKKFQRMEQSLREKKALNEDRLDSLKDQIERLERNVLFKKREYDAAKGDTKRIVGGEIERLFKELDRSRGQEEILARNIEQITLALAKQAEIKAALDSSVDEGAFDELALELQDVIGELKAADQAAKELETMQYAASRTDSVDIDARMASLEADNSERQAATPESQQEASNGLSQASLDRLKEFDSEE